MDIQVVKRRAPLLYKAYLHYRMRSFERKLIGETASFGDANPDKTFFIIRLNNPYLGLMAIYNSVLGYVKYALAHNYTPVVDLKNYKNGYLYENEIGRVNSWEYYFEQPCGVSLEEAYKSKNVIFSSGVSPYEAHPMVLEFLLRNRFHADAYFKIIKNNLRVRKPLVDKYQADYERLIGKKRIIGVVSRGSDLINTSGHAIQPSQELLISTTKKKLSDWNCEYVFLASEEVHVVDSFRKEFGSKLIITSALLYSKTTEYIPLVDQGFDRENDKYLKGEEYLYTLFVLSKCNALIGSLVGGTLGAIEFNGNAFEHKFIFDLGVY